mmetsp:Transcript_26632/g.68774  ORF Transcript_26632/g.68774 Transcript_26632/m.68774 type:complete len:308 (-) Transcript_26632:2751-3674(-)
MTGQGAIEELGHESSNLQPETKLQQRALHCIPQHHRQEEGGLRLPLPKQERLRGLEGHGVVQRQDVLQDLAVPRAERSDVHLHGRILAIVARPSPAHRSSSPMLRSPAEWRASPAGCGHRSGDRGRILHLPHLEFIIHGSQSIQGVRIRPLSPAQPPQPIRNEGIGRPHVLQDVEGGASHGKLRRLAGIRHHQVQQTNAVNLLGQDPQTRRSRGQLGQRPQRPPHVGDRIPLGSQQQLPELRLEHLGDVGPAALRVAQRSQGVRRNRGRGLLRRAGARLNGKRHANQTPILIPMAVKRHPQRVHEAM